MVPFTKNVKSLHELFVAVHSRQQNDCAFNNYLSKLYWTNEVTGIVRVDKMLLPTFIRGVDQTANLERITEKIITLSGNEPVYKTCILRPFWSADDYKKIEIVYAYKDGNDVLDQIFLIAFDVIKRLPSNEKVSILCGPAPVGTTTFDNSLSQVYKKTVEVFSEENPLFFNFAPLLPLLDRATNLLKEKYPSDYFCKRFYKAIFALKKDWQPSFMNQYKGYPQLVSIHDFFVNKKMPIRYLPSDYHLG